VECGLYSATTNLNTTSLCTTNSATVTNLHLANSISDHVRAFRLINLNMAKKLEHFKKSSYDPQLYRITFIAKYQQDMMWWLSSMILVIHFLHLLQLSNMQLPVSLNIQWTFTTEVPTYHCIQC